MHPDLAKIARELVEVAARIDPEGLIVEVCRRFESDSDQQILIVAEDLETAAIGSQAIDGDVGTRTFEQLLAEPLEAGFPFLLGVFRSDRLISGKAASAVESLFFSRPSATYGFFFLDVDTLQSPDDRARLDRSAWRLLVPDPKPAWSSQNLESKKIFMLHTSQAFPLDRVFPVPASEAKHVSKSFLSEAIARLDKMLQGDLVRSGRESLIDRIDLARKRLLELKERLSRRIDSAAERALVAARALVERLALDLEPLLEQRLAAGSNGITRDPVQALVSSWREALDSDLDGRWKEAASETEDLFPPAEEPTQGWIQGVNVPSISPTGSTGETLPSWALGTAGTLIVASRWIVPDLLMPMVRWASPVLGAVLLFSGWQLHTTQRRRQREHFERELRRAMAGMSRKLIEEIQERIRVSFSGMKARALVEVDNRLAGLEREEKQELLAAGGLPSPEADRMKLRELRRLLAGL